MKNLQIFELKGIKHNLVFKFILNNLFPPIFIVVILSIVLFDYINGSSSPSWDFFGDYFTSAYSWWDLGNFFHPPTYLPYLISGVPAHLALQVSSYYVPVGIVAEFFGYTIENAIRLQFITIVFGVLGIYFLLKSWNFSNSISCISSFCYFFSAGYFSNSSHVDIVRAWSFLPWLLLSVRQNRQKNKYLIFIYSLLWFQFFVGAYPGNIASYFYILLIWVIFINIIEKDNFKNNILYYCKIILPALMMSSLKWLPFLVTGKGPEITNQIKFNSGILTTIFFPYQGLSNTGELILPNDVTQRTFFVVPIFLFLMIFAKNNHKLFQISLIVLLVSSVLGIDYSLSSHWQEYLPLLDISRFRTIDFKPGISLAVTILSAIGLNNLLEKKDTFSKKINRPILMLVTFVTLYVIFVFQTNNFLKSDFYLGLKWIGLSILSILLCTILIQIKFKNIAFLILLSLVIYIGDDWANSYLPTWKNNIIDTERVYFGEETKNLIMNQNEINLIERPERNGPSIPIPYPGEMIIQYWNKNELLRNYSIGGYVTIKGEEIFQKYVDYAVDKDKSKVIDFLAQKSSILFINPGDKISDNCLYENGCEFITNDYKFIEYSPNSFEVQINPMDKKTYLFINEINWKGWNIKTCDTFNICSNLKIKNDQNLILQFEIPIKTKFIRAHYKTPYIEYSWILFWGGLLLAMLFTFIMIRKNDKYTNLYTSI